MAVKPKIGENSAFTNADLGYIIPKGKMFQTTLLLHSTIS